MVTFVSTYTIAPGVTYGVHPHHRNGMRRKSQWTISEDQERGVFVDARDKNWILQDIGWGLKIVEGRVAYLGVAQNHITQLFVAKFVNGNRKQSWHGYPADHQRHTQDIPNETMLQRWLDDGVLPPQKIAKLQRGKPCSL
jgi:hypothetical protein